MAEGQIPFKLKKFEGFDEETGSQRQEAGGQSEALKPASDQSGAPGQLPFSLKPAEPERKRGELGLPLNPPREPEPEGSEYMKGLKRGGYETAALGTAGGGMLADLAGNVAGYVGFESGEEWLNSVSEDALAQAEELSRQAQQYSPEVGKVEDIDNLAEFTSWASGVLGEQTPIIAGAIMSGGVGSIVGKVAVKKALKKGTKEQLENQVKKWSRRGATGGVGAFASTVEGGGIYQETAEATGETYPGLSAAGGLAAGALETLPFITVARRLGLGKKAASGLMQNIDALPRGKRALATGALVAGQEAGTESLQEAIAMTARDLVDENYEALGEEGVSRLFNATAAGGLVGGGTGTVAGAVGQGAPAQGEGLPPVSPSDTGAQGPQQAPAPARLPPPPTYAAPPEGLTDRTGEQRSLFLDPIQAGIRESAPPRAEEVAGPRQRISEQQMEFGEFLTPFRTERGSGIIAIGEDNRASETDLTSIQESIITDISRRDAGFGGAELKELITGEPGPQFEPTGPIETPTEPVSPEPRLYRNTRVVGQARKHGRNVQDLMDRRNEILQSDEAYTQKGDMRASARKKLNTIEAGIRKSSEQAGLPNPIEQGATKEAESTEEAISEKGQRGIEEEYVDQTEGQEFIAAGEAVEDVSNVSDPEEFIRATEEAAQDLGFADEVGDGGLDALRQLDAAYNALSRDKQTELQDSYQFARNSIMGVLDQDTQAQAEKEQLVRDDVRRQQQREQVREARRRVEGRRQVGQEQAQRRFDEEVDRQLREQGIDPDQLDDDISGILESRTQADRTRRQADQAKRQTDEHVENVRSFVQGLQEQFPGLRNVDVIVKSRMGYVADYGANDPRTAMALRTGSNGFYVPRDSMQIPGENAEAHIIADKIPAEPQAMKKEAERIFVHEALVHGGLDSVLTQQEKQSFRQTVVEKAKDQEVWQQIKQAYGDRSEYIQAEEYVARVAQTNSDPSLLRRIAAKVRKALRRFFPNLRITQNEIRTMLADMKAGLTRGSLAQTRAPLKPYVSSSGRTYDHRAASNIDSLLHDLEVGEGPERSQWSADINHQAKIWKADLANMFLTPLQLSKEYQIEPMTRYYTNVVPRWWNIKSEILDNAEQTLTEVQKLGQDKVDTLGRMLFRATLESDRQQKRLGIQELLQLWEQPDGVVQKNAIQPDQELLDMFEKMDESIRQLTTRMERGLKYNAIRETIAPQVENPDQVAQQILEAWNRSRNENERMQAIAELVPNLYGQELLPISRLQEIESQFDMMRNRNYFPLMRFGRYTASVVATKDGVEYDGETFNAGEPIIFETYEGPGPQQQRKKELIDEIGERDGMKVHSGKLTEEEFSFLGLPPALQQNIEQNLELSEDQKARLQEIFIKMSPGRSFLKHLLKRKGTRGFSTDLLRVYAGYMSNAAGHLARTETHLDMQQAITDMDSVSQEWQRSGSNTDATIVDKMRDAMRQHYDWIMNPRGELAGLRSIGFMWYLGFNPRSALVNLTQVPLATYPYLSERYGDRATVRELRKAYKAGARSPRGEKVNVDNETWQMMDQGVREGWIDESLATEVAGYAESGALQRIMPSDKTTSMINKVSYYGSWMFSQAEQYNRRVTAVAAYRLARKSGESHDAAVDAARSAVQDTQFEYAKWNRPGFMRGKQSIFFLFWQYMQHATYLAAGRHGKGTAGRFWLMLGLAGGLQGLPYAEVFMTLLNQMGTEVKEWLGLDDPKVDLQKDLRELASDLGANPELVMNGLSRYYGLGPLHIASTFGAPVPNVDISGSISMGNFPPGVTQLLKGEGARATQEASGAIFNVPIALWKVLTSDNPDKWKEWERAMPTVLRNASRSVRYMERGQEETSSGAQLIEFDPYDTQHRAEQIAQFFGFPSSRKNVAWEELMAKREAKRYYLTRRTMLLQDFAYAKRRNSREGLADVRKAIREFNNSVPSPKLRITSDQLRQSLERRMEARRKQEMGLPSEDMARGIYREIDALFPED